MIQGLTGLRYDAIDGAPHMEPSVRGHFRTFVSTSTGVGAAGVSNGGPSVAVKSGAIDIERIEHLPQGADQVPDSSERDRPRIRMHGY